MTDLILPNGRFVPVVTKFKYLGSYISSDGSDTIDVQSRIDSADRAFGALSKCIFRSQNIDRKAKSAIYESLILSICLYGCESWCLTEKLYSKLRQFHARCVRTMSHITLAQSRMYQIPTREIETELGLDSMDKYIARRQLRWLGHVSRMPFDRLPRRLLSSWLPYKRPRGAPEMTFGKTMIKALKTFDIDPKHWPAMAANRNNWRHRINK